MSLTAEHFLALLPLLVLGAATVVVMLAAAFARGASAPLTAAGLAAALAALPLAGSVAPLGVTPLLVVDGYALFFTGLLSGAALAVTALVHAYFEPRAERRDELYVLLLAATAGGAVLVASRHFASFFLGLELMSVSLFALVAYRRRERTGLEAGVKYLVLSGVSSAFILFGMALVYAELGTLEFAQMSAMLAGTAPLRAVFLLAGLALVVSGIAFKLSIVPFHLWTPDVYEGAPAPVTAFLATVSKGAVFALLLRYFAEAGGYAYPPLLWALGALAAASMLVGNALALLQDDVKRILAYSSIAHVGYLLVALLAASRLAIESVSYYLAAYFVTTIGAFAVVALLSTPGGAGEAQRLEEYRGLAWRRPWLAGVFTLMLLSLAGIPLTMGFVAKFYVFAAGVQSAPWVLVGALVVGSAAGLFYYLRVIVALFAEPASAGAPAPPAAPVPLSGRLALAALTLLLLWLGTYPASLVDVIWATAMQLV